MKYLHATSPISLKTPLVVGGGGRDPRLKIADLELPSRKMSENFPRFASATYGM